MLLLFRGLWIVLASRFRPRLGPLEESRVRMRVWPNDLDVNVHMNNGRYLTVMDLGRLDLIARNGIVREVIRRRLMPLVGTATMHFFRPLPPFAKYTLRTRLAGWDEKWFYIEQRFEIDGVLYAAGVVKGLFRSREGNVPPGEMLASAGHDGPSPLLSPAIAELMQAERRWVGELKG